MKNKYYYSVRSGRKIGVYDNWNDCENQVTGYTNAQYKKFTSYEEAYAYAHGYDFYIASTSTLKFNNNKNAECYINGSYDDEINEIAYGIIIIEDNKETINLSDVVENDSPVNLQSIYPKIKAAETAILYGLKKKISEMVIYYDYDGIRAWCTGEWKNKNRAIKKYIDIYNYASKYIDIKFAKIEDLREHRYNKLAKKLSTDALKK